MLPEPAKIERVGIDQRGIGSRHMEMHDLGTRNREGVESNIIDAYGGVGGVERGPGAVDPRPLDSGVAGIVQVTTQVNRVSAKCVRVEQYCRKKYESVDTGVYWHGRLTRVNDRTPGECKVVCVRRRHILRWACGPGTPARSVTA